MATTGGTSAQNVAYIFGTYSVVSSAAKTVTELDSQHQKKQTTAPPGRQFSLFQHNLYSFM